MGLFHRGEPLVSGKKGLESLIDPGILHHKYFPLIVFLKSIIMDLFRFIKS
jgi:hypothetical protein